MLKKEIYGVISYFENSKLKHEVFGYIKDALGELSEASRTNREVIELKYQHEKKMCEDKGIARITTEISKNEKVITIEKRI